MRHLSAMNEWLVGYVAAILTLMLALLVLSRFV